MTQIKLDPTHSDSLLGAVVDGRYRILELLGEGAMGAVFKAEQVRLSRPVALKIPFPHLIMDERFRERFEREALATARLRHENIVQIHDVYVSEQMDELSYIVLEYVEGINLDRYIRLNEAQLTLGDALNLFIGVGAGLSAAHEAGIVHRDIKPGNIIVTTDGTAKVLDFGVARMEDTPGATQTGSSIGTPLFMAPEQVRGERGIGPAADIYAMTVTIYRELARKHPYDTTSGQSAFYAHVNERPTPLRQVNPAISPAMEAVVMRGLEKVPTDRPSSAMALAAELLMAATSDGLMETPLAQMMPEVDHTGRRLTSTPPPSPSKAMVGRFIQGGAAAILSRQATQVMGAALPSGSSAAPMPSTHLPPAGSSPNVQTRGIGQFVTGSGSGMGTPLPDSRIGTPALPSASGSSPGTAYMPMPPTQIGGGYSAPTPQRASGGLMRYAMLGLFIIVCVIIGVLTAVGIVRNQRRAAAEPQVQAPAAAVAAPPMQALVATPSATMVVAAATPAPEASAQPGFPLPPLPPAAGNATAPFAHFLQDPKFVVLAQTLLIGLDAPPDPNDPGTRGVIAHGVQALFDEPFARREIHPDVVNLAQGSEHNRGASVASMLENALRNQPEGRLETRVGRCSVIFERLIAAELIFHLAARPQDSIESSPQARAVLLLGQRDGQLHPLHLTPGATAPARLPERQAPNRPAIDRPRDRPRLPPRQ